MDIEAAGLNKNQQLGVGCTCARVRQIKKSMYLVSLMEAVSPWVPKLSK
jgi:hypothetical protein